MVELSLGAPATLPGASPAVAPEKVQDAARQFEALLLGQILRSARGDGGWLGSNDGASDCAMEYAEQQLASLLAEQGGLGLAGLIAQGLTQADAALRQPSAPSAAKPVPER
jgi:Rod binding domain-containing protein